MRLYDSPLRRPLIQQMVPKSGLCRSYVARAQRLTDAPAVYHLGAFLSFFGAMVLPRARLRFEGQGASGTQPLHLWVFLCGPSYNRKSHALDMAGAAWRPYLKDRMCPDSGSREGFEDFFEAVPHAVLSIREAPTWLADNHAAWMRNGSAWWCKIFDGVLERKLIGSSGRKKGDREPEFGYRQPSRSSPVCVTIAAAGETTAVMAQTKSHATDWTGGMFSRMLVLSAGRVKERDKFFDWPAADLAALRSRMDRILSLVRRHPIVTISDQAWTAYKRWHDPVWDTMEGLTLAQAALVGRLGRHCQVMAALYSISCEENVVSAESMEAAVQVARHSHQDVLELPLPSSTF